MNTCWYTYTKSLEMEKALTPGRLDVDPSSPNTAKEFNHWLKTFTYFLAVLPQDGLDKLSVLTNFVSPHVYDYIIECETYEDAMRVLISIFVKPQNEVFARHLLLTRKQNPDETVDEYLQALKILSKDCNFKPVDAVTYCNEVVRDVFISGLQSIVVSEKLLENKTLDLFNTVEQARLLDAPDVDVKSSTLLTEENYEETLPVESEGTKVAGNIQNQPSYSNGLASDSESTSKRKRRKNGNIRDSRGQYVDTKNILSSINTRRRSGTIKESRVKIESKNIQHRSLLVARPILRRVGRLKSATLDKQTTKQDWRQRLAIKQSAIELMRRRSHRMRKPPERLDW